MRNAQENGPRLLRRLEHDAATPPAAAAAARSSPTTTTEALVAACGQAHRLSRLGGASPVRWAAVPAAVPAGTMSQPPSKSGSGVGI